MDFSNFTKKEEKIIKRKIFYWKSHCKQTCPKAEHCLEKHLSDKEITLSILKNCFLTQPRVGLGTYEEYFNL